MDSLFFHMYVLLLCCPSELDISDAVIPEVTHRGSAGSRVKHYLVYVRTQTLFPEPAAVTVCLLGGTCIVRLPPAAPSAAMKRTDAISEDVLMDSL